MKINASKEQVERAIVALGRLRAELRYTTTVQDDKDLDTIAQVLGACARKVPTEASYAREKARKLRYSRNKRASDKERRGRTLVEVLTDVDEPVAVG